MAKATMGRSKFKIQRRLGVELPGLGRAGALERRPYGPGQHGMKRKKLSDYTIRLMEKQKIIFNYGLRERQLVNYVRKSKKNKSRPWVDVLLTTLEARLDNVVFRLGFAPSLMAARQMVTHGHVFLNGKKVDVPAALVHPNDRIHLSANGYTSGNFLQAKARPRLLLPGFLKKQMEGDKEVGVMIANPLPEDVPFTFQNQFLTEFYWKV
jgi:small subunit ribosomal protein S4